MPAYQFTDPAPVIMTLLGIQGAANGSLTFYEEGTTTPKNTWSDPVMDVPSLNPNPVPLDSAGRSEVPIWLDGNYTVVAKAQDGSTVWTRVMRPEIAPGLAIPSLVGKIGFYLSNDGTNLVWVDIANLLLPDPTGSAGYMLVVNSDGTGYTLQAIPELPEPDITVAADKVVIGGGGALKKMELFGTGTAPASGTTQTSVNIDFPTDFKSGTVPFVSLTITNAQSSGPFVPRLNGNPTSSGFVVVIDVAEGNSAGGNITTPPTFQWKAEGVIDA